MSKDRPDRKFGGDKKLSPGAPDRGPRKDFGNRSERGPERGDSKPWQKRDAGSPHHSDRNSRPPRDGARNFDRPKFDKPRYDKSREDRPQGDGPFRERPKFASPREGRDGRPKFERPREARGSWQEHPRSDARSFDGNADRPDSVLLWRSGGVGTLAGICRPFAPTVFLHFTSERSSRTPARSSKEWVFASSTPDRLACWVNG